MDQTEFPQHVHEPDSWHRLLRQRWRRSPAASSLVTVMVYMDIW
jgi:hypothetical protein